MSRRKKTKAAPAGNDARKRVVALVILLIVLLIGALFIMRTQTVELQEGARAPDFELADAHGRVRKLSDYHGNWLVIYFYPKDDTPGCTQEACRFRDDYSAIRDLGVTVLGVSLDSSQSHARFTDKYELPFTLLSDPDGRTTQAYGALWKFGPIKFAKRHTYVIDPFGRIARVYRKVSTSRHSAQIIEDMRELKRNAR